MRNTEYMNGNNWFIIAMMIIICTTAGILLLAYWGFSEAAHNRQKSEHLYELCLEKGQPILNCKAAFESNNN